MQALLLTYTNFKNDIKGNWFGTTKVTTYWKYWENISTWKSLLFPRPTTHLIYFQFLNIHSLSFIPFVYWMLYFSHLPFMHSLMLRYLSKPTLKVYDFLVFPCSIKNDLQGEFECFCCIKYGDKRYVDVEHRTICWTNSLPWR